MNQFVMKMRFPEKEPINPKILVGGSRIHANLTYNSLTK